MTEKERKKERKQYKQPLIWLVYYLSFGAHRDHQSDQRSCHWPDFSGNGSYVWDELGQRTVARLIIRHGV